MTVLALALEEMGAQVAVVAVLRLVYQITEFLVLAYLDKETMGVLHKIYMAAEEAELVHLEVMELLLLLE
jgi:hypothetical protein